MPLKARAELKAASSSPRHVLVGKTFKRFLESLGWLILFFQKPENSLFTFFSKLYFCFLRQHWNAKSKFHSRKKGIDLLYFLKSQGHLSFSCTQGKLWDTAGGSRWTLEPRILYWSRGRPTEKHGSVFKHFPLSYLSVGGPRGRTAPAFSHAIWDGNTCFGPKSEFGFLVLLKTKPASRNVRI